MSRAGVRRGFVRAVGARPRQCGRRGRRLDVFGFVSSAGAYPISAVVLMQSGSDLMGTVGHVLDEFFHLAAVVQDDA